MNKRRANINKFGITKKSDDELQNYIKINYGSMNANGIYVSSRGVLGGDRVGEQAKAREIVATLVKDYLTSCIVGNEIIPRGMKVKNQDWWREMGIYSAL